MEGITDVHTAVDLAKATVNDLFKPKSNPRLEEVNFEDERGHDFWKITVSFLSPSDAHPLAWALEPKMVRRFKVVRIRDRDGKVVSVTRRPPSS